ncbi:MAG: flavodoxin [Eubacteriaceae bacterium]|nr:flavodoxin [Eubacteriaceae bacterium]
MSDIAVIYKSKYGSTKKYAQWISEELKADLFERSDIKEEDINKYKTIIFGGGLYASGIIGIDIIKKNFEKIKSKNIIVFTVGLGDPKNKEQFVPIINQNFTDEMKENISIFHLRGSMDYSKLNFMHRSMMGMVKKSVDKKSEENRTEEDMQMLETYGDKVDFIDKNTILPIIELAKSF